jgi:hypothetical protein
MNSNKIISGTDTMVVTNIYLVIEYCRTQLLAALPYEWQQHSTVEVSELALLYLNLFGSPPKGSGRRSHNVSTEVKFDKKDHFGQPTEENKLMAQYCKSKVRTECRKCKFGFCLKYFLAYHTL